MGSYHSDSEFCPSSSELPAGLFCPPFMLFFVPFMLFFVSFCHCLSLFVSLASFPLFCPLSCPFSLFSSLLPFSSPPPPLFTIVAWIIYTTQL